MARLCERLGVEPGVPRADGRVTVDNTSCTGMPDQGPAILVNGLALTHLTPARVDTAAGAGHAGRGLHAVGGAGGAAAGAAGDGLRAGRQSDHPPAAQAVAAALARASRHRRWGTWFCSRCKMHCRKSGVSATTV